MPVAAKALAAAPDDRWPTAAALAAEIRKAAGLKLAPASTAAAFARSGIGERVKARRESLDGSSAPSPSMPARPAPSPEPPRIAPAVEPSPAPPKVAEENESVLVAPGIRAPVEEVVELESSLLVAAPDSVAPPAPSSAVGGFVLDPFAAAASLAKSPPPPPVPITPDPVHFAVADAQPISINPSELTADEAPSSVTGAPHFAAAIDLQPPPAPPPPPPPAPPAPARLAVVAMLPVTVASAEEPEPFPAPGAGRRKVLVLGGVAALGLVVFALAAIRIATRSEDAAPATTRPSVANAQPVAPTVSAASAPPPADTAAAASAPASSPPAPPPPPTQAAPSPQPPPAQVAPPPPPPPPQVAPPPPPRVVPAPPQAPPRPPPAAVRPRPKPTFDPNSL